MIGLLIKTIVVAGVLMLLYWVIAAMLAAVATLPTFVLPLVALILVLIFIGWVIKAWKIDI